jgi:hypothetical protein
MSSEREAIETKEPDALIPGRGASQARVVAAGLTNDDIDRRIKQAREEGLNQMRMNINIL